MRELEYYSTAGQTIDDALNGTKQLAEMYKKYNAKAFCYFNDKKIYSDDTIDAAYERITGKTKAQFDKEREAERKAYEDELAAYKASIPELTEKYIKKGHKVLDKKYWNAWNDMVPIQLDDIYRGMDLDASLEIIKALNDNKSLEEIKEIIDNQGHSGMSYLLVISMIKSLHDKGPELFNYLREK